MEVSSNELRKAVESQHGGPATLVTKLPVKEVFEGKTFWEGVVHILLRGERRRRPGGGIAGEHRSADHRRFGYARSADGCDRGVPLEHVCLELNRCT